MDPSANLREQREIIATLTSPACETYGDHFDKIRRLVELSQALDEWLSNGGAVPAAWQEGCPTCGR